RVKEADDKGEVAATYASQEAAQDEGKHLGASAVDPHDLRSELVAAYAQPSPAVGRIHEVPNQHDAQDHTCEDQGEQRRDAYRTNHQVSELGKAAEPSRPTNTPNVCCERR